MKQLRLLIKDISKIYKDMGLISIKSIKVFALHTAKPCSIYNIEYDCLSTEPRVCLEPG